MSADEITAEIEKLTRARQAIWRGEAQAMPGEIERIAVKLAELYEAKRHAGAQMRRRDSIIRRARVESELERLTAR